jgi:hypothetical protein
VVDTGIPAPPAELGLDPASAGAFVATHGLSRVSARAAAEWLAR